MAHFIDFEAESDNSENEELNPSENRRLKKMQAMSDTEDEDDGDEMRLRDELNDLIDDSPIDEDSDDADPSKNGKRKKSDDEDELDDRLDEDDYELIEENLGVKVKRQKRFKRLKRNTDSDDEQEMDVDAERQTIANQLFDEGQGDEDRQHVGHQAAVESEISSEEDEDEESDTNDFIVDDDDRPMAVQQKPTKRAFNDTRLQEGQDIFGVDFDYDEFDKENDYDDVSETDDEYEDDGFDSVEMKKKKKRSADPKKSMKPIFEIYEPSDLKRGHLTDLDNVIRKNDIPERMQLREVPLTFVPEGSNELEEEAAWIYNRGFVKSSISNQQGWSKPPSAIGKIKQALDYMRNQKLEVPFIAFYRKEYVQPELNVNDLWKVYNFDSKWCQLHSRRKTLIKLFEKMRNYQDQNSDSSMSNDIRLIKDDDIDRIRQAQTQEELQDVHAHFMLHYAHEIQPMNEAYKREKHSGGEKIEDDHTFPEKSLKSAADTGPYSVCRKGGILGIAKRFGLTPEQFAENLSDNYQRHECNQETTELTELAREYISPRFPRVEDVVAAARFVVASQLARNPTVRKSIRETFYQSAKISVVATKKGHKEIDESHCCYSMKYLKNKPVRDLVGDQFLKLCMAEDDKLITIVLSEEVESNNSSRSYLEELKSMYRRDEFSKNVQEWNAIRANCVEDAVNKMVLPDIRRELKTILLNEAKNAVLKACCLKLNSWIKVAPYSAPDFSEDNDWNTTKGIRVMGVAYTPEFDKAAFCAVVSPDGDVSDYLRIPHILKRKTSFRVEERAKKEADLAALKNFIRNKKPHVIAIGGESREALMIQQDFQQVIRQLIDDEQFPTINVEIIDNEPAKIYSQSKKGTADFCEYPTILRQAISIGRRVRDPLVEFSQLCTADDEILCLRYHTLQDQLPKEQLLENLYLEFINRTNEVGVDVSLALKNTLSMNLVQFICGLGPRKGQALIKILRQKNQQLENREQLVTVCHMGPRVFINCSGFIKIDTKSMSDSTDGYVEALDGSRVHPEAYEWARKMAFDTLEYDYDDANPSSALETILETPDDLQNLDLDAFATELDRQGSGDRSITLYDIRTELTSPYKDMRTQFSSARPDELFYILTKETPTSFCVGKIMLAHVSGISYRRPRGERLDKASPVQNRTTRLWQCPFCLCNDFPDLSLVWQHCDNGECRGQAMGINLWLDNGLNGFVHIRNLSDQHVKNLEEHVALGKPVHVRIVKIDFNRFQVECSSKASDLNDQNNKWRPAKDPYYDHDMEAKEMLRDDDTKKKQPPTYFKRITNHPSFHNKTYTESFHIMAALYQGEVMVRPSSKAPDHLTLTWKVADDIYQHIDVLEEGKENVFSLGQTLWIGTEQFEDLDEIIARFVTPMAAYAREILIYKYYLKSSDKMEEVLKDAKKKNPNKNHYFLSASKKYAGKFLLSYMTGSNIRHEYCTVTPDGIQFRQQVFGSIHLLLNWFKEHFNDHLPCAVPENTTKGLSTSTNSYIKSYKTGAINVTSETIQNVAQNMPSDLMLSLSKLASTSNKPNYSSVPTPFMGSTYTPSYYTPKYDTTSESENMRLLQPCTPIGSVRSYSTTTSNSKPWPSHSHRSPRHSSSSHTRTGGRGENGNSSYRQERDHRGTSGDKRRSTHRGSDRTQRYE